jgi:ferredoxin
MIRTRRVLIVLSIWLLCTSLAPAIERFPPPEFEVEYVMPDTTVPAPRVESLQILDVAVLIAALSLASWLVLKKRSRRGVFWLMLFCLVYFGFWRKGSVCSIGAIGNISLSIFNPEYAVPWFVVAFFFLPLVFTLFFGRSFCAAVCPLGAIQDAVLLRPMKIPAWLETALRLCAWLYLSLAVLFAVTASAFIICRYDPFIAFFRFSANPAMWVVSIATLVIAVFVGRPYCRFLCPYGVLLRQVARVSKFFVKITPDECIHCRLCEDSCPFGAIEKPTVEWPQKEYIRGKQRLMLLIAGVPVFMAIGVFAGYKVAPKLATAHPTVALTQRVKLEQAGVYTDRIDASKAFYASGQTLAQLYAENDQKQKQFAVGSAILGGWMGLIAVVSLLQHSIFWKRTEYQAHRAGCLACGRCYNYCPRHRKWKENVK